MAGYEYFPPEHLNTPAICQRVRDTRPNTFGRPMLHSDAYADWYINNYLPFAELFDPLEQLNLLEGTDLESVPTTYRDYYAQAINLCDYQGKSCEAALAQSGLGAASAFLLGYAETLSNDDYIKKHRLDPMIAAKARIEHAAAQAVSDRNGSFSFREYNNKLGIWLKIFRNDSETLHMQANEFIKENFGE